MNERFLRLAAALRHDFPEQCAGDGSRRYFSAPGRTELGGNHTDHNRGKVLAASVQLDACAAVVPRADNVCVLRTVSLDGGKVTQKYPDVEISLEHLAPAAAEYGKTEGLLRGVAASFRERGLKIGGWTAVNDTAVPGGSGLSSSAAIEALIGRIFDALYNDGSLPAVEIAKIGQEAENKFFGKPCGLMDQIACAHGGAEMIDFADPENPVITPVPFDFGATGCTLCVCDTRGSHADLTDDYAAIPAEMKAVAALFGKTALRDVSREDVAAWAGEIRKQCGDRALLRSLHFFDENKRVEAEVKALLKGDFDGYLALVNESGASSERLLQNIYAPQHPETQAVSVALAATRGFLKGGSGRPGACRVHGGGFAGTIQAYIPSPRFDAYRELMEGIFGAGCVTELRIRDEGAVEVREK
jgi:galactokinase